MRKILSYVRPYAFYMSVGMFIKFVGALMDLALPYILAYLIDDVAPTKNVTAIYLWGVVMLICSIIAWVTNIVANRMASKVARDTTRSIRHDLYERINNLSCRQTDEFTCSVCFLVQHRNRIAEDEGNGEYICVDCA